MAAEPHVLSSVSEEADASATAPVLRRKYTGLANQGATCYMNSLLQSLFMTPELRRTLFEWRQAPAQSAVASTASSGSASAGAAATTDAEDSLSECIPYQLQVLFGALQLSSQRAVTTTALTRSFGWGGADSFQQHDVQELAKVLIDALERSLAGTPRATLVNDLFKGTCLDFVRCEECGAERSRADTFTDLQLPVKPFGATEALGSVAEALDEYFRAEVMDDTDKVECTRCARKTRSAKGLKLSQPPYLLQLLLKRYVRKWDASWPACHCQACERTYNCSLHHFFPPLLILCLQICLRLRHAEPPKAKRPHDLPSIIGLERIRGSDSGCCRCECT